MTITIWDFALLFVVTALSVMVAYLYRPDQKAFIISLPIPATLVILSIGINVSAGNMLGLSLLLLFTLIVYFVYSRHIMGIFTAIISASVFYVVFGIILMNVYPMTETGFIIAALWNFGLGGVLIFFMSPQKERGHRSPMPVWLKILVVSGVIIMLIILKKQLGGFMMAFPMVGIIAVYEGRYSLWGISCQIPLVMLTLGMQITLIHYLYPIMGLYWALAAAWVVFMIIIIQIHRIRWADQQKML